MAADARGRDHDVDDVVLADHDLADLAHDAVSQFVHRNVLSSVTRATTRPSASTSSELVGASPQCHDLVVREPHLAGGGLDGRAIRVGREPRLSLDPLAAPRAERRERGGGVCGALERGGHGVDVHGPGGRQRARRLIGRSEAAGPGPREHDRRDADREEGDLPAARKRAESACLAVAVHTFGEHDRCVGRPRERETEGGVVGFGDRARSRSEIRRRAAAPRRRSHWCCREARDRLRAPWAPGRSPRRTRRSPSVRTVRSGPRDSANSS